MKYGVSMKNIDFIISRGQAFHDKSTKENSRYKSWGYCYAIFQEAHNKKNLNNEDYNNLCLHLAFYLASWGMYRGSSFLIYRDYLIHKEVVELILSEEYRELWNLKITDYEKEEIQLLIKKLSEKISGKYKTIRESVNKEKKEEIVTDKDEDERENDISKTLITKVLMGTIGCVSAYDRLFVNGLKQYDISPRIYGTNSITTLTKLYCEYPEFEKFRKENKFVINGEKLEYPTMKVLDMCFWQIGKDIEDEEKRKKLNKSK